MTLTKAQIAGLKHAGLSLIITSIVAACVTASPYIMQDGEVNWKFVGALFLFALLLSLAHGVSEYLRVDAKAQAATNPQTASTELTISDILDGFLTKFQAMFPGYSVSSALSAVPATPLVTIHTSGPVTTTTTTNETTTPASTPIDPPKIGDSISDATTQKIDKSELPNATVPLVNDDPEDTQSSLMAIKKAS